MPDSGHSCARPPFPPRTVASLITTRRCIVFDCCSSPCFARFSILCIGCILKDQSLATSWVRVGLCCGQGQWIAGLRKLMCSVPASNSVVFAPHSFPALSPTEGLSLCRMQTHPYGGGGARCPPGQLFRLAPIGRPGLANKIACGHMDICLKAV